MQKWSLVLTLFLFGCNLVESNKNPSEHFSSSEISSSSSANQESSSVAVEPCIQNLSLKECITQLEKSTFNFYKTRNSGISPKLSSTVETIVTFEDGLSSVWIEDIFQTTLDDTSSEGSSKINYSFEELTSQFQYFRSDFTGFRIQSISTENGITTTLFTKSEQIVGAGTVSKYSKYYSLEGILILETSSSGSGMFYNNSETVNSDPKLQDLLNVLRSLE